MSDSTNPKDLIGVKKPRLSLCSPAGMVYESLAMGDGSVKYGSFNFRHKKVQALIYVDACMRHLLSWVDREENAKDSGLPHLGHAKACLGILIDALETGNLIDDRPAPGKTADIIERYTKKDAK